MTIDLTPEQERRLQAVLSRGAYQSVEEVVEAALAAVEQRTVPGFAGTPEELDSLLLEGLASKELSETEFWNSAGGPFKPGFGLSGDFRMHRVDALTMKVSNSPHNENRVVWATCRVLRARRKSSTLCFSKGWRLRSYPKPNSGIR